MNEELKAIAQSPPRAGVSNSFGWGWKSMKSNFLVFFLTVIVVGIVQTPNNWPDEEFIGWQTEQGQTEAGEDGDQEDRVVTTRGPFLQNSNPLFGLLIMAYMILLVPVFKYGADLVFLRGTRGEKVEMKTLIEGFSKYLNVVLASLLVFALCAIGFVFFIIPGIIAACRLAFVPYLVMDEDMDPIEAVEGSWRLTRGHAWKVFGLYLLAIPICIIGLLLMIVGIFPALMWLSATFAALYLSVTGGRQEAEPEVLSPAPASPDTGSAQVTADTIDA